MVKDAVAVTVKITGTSSANGEHTLTWDNEGQGYYDVPVGLYFHPGQGKWKVDEDTGDDDAGLFIFQGTNQSAEVLPPFKDTETWHVSGPPVPGTVVSDFKMTLKSYKAAVVPTLMRSSAGVGPKAEIILYFIGNKPIVLEFKLGEYLQLDTGNSEDEGDESGDEEDEKDKGSFKWNDNNWVLYDGDTEFTFIKIGQSETVLPFSMDQPEVNSEYEGDEGDEGDGVFVYTVEFSFYLGLSHGATVKTPSGKTEIANKVTVKISGVTDLTLTWDKEKQEYNSGDFSLYFNYETSKWIFNNGEEFSFKGNQSVEVLLSSGWSKDGKDSDNWAPEIKIEYKGYEAYEA